MSHFLHKGRSLSGKVGYWEKIRISPILFRPLDPSKGKSVHFSETDCDTYKRCETVIDTVKKVSWSFSILFWQKPHFYLVTETERKRREHVSPVSCCGSDCCKYYMIFISNNFPEILSIYQYIRIFEWFEYSNKSFWIFRFGFGFGPIANFE